LKFVHIAGTNGKGSVSLKVSKVFEKAGFKTGLYTSPHLFSFRERIQVTKKNKNGTKKIFNY
jgi:dihydrofolate synthase/folylpolyglutamate synthase